MRVVLLGVRGNTGGNEQSAVATEIVDTKVVRGDGTDTWSALWFPAILRISAGSRLRDGLAWGSIALMARVNTPQALARTCVE